MTDVPTKEEILLLVNKARDRKLSSDEADRLALGVLNLTEGKDW